MSVEGKWPWSELGLSEQPENAKEIRRAYARLLKERDFSADVPGFERLRKAYEFALNLTRDGKPRHEAIAPIFASHSEGPAEEDSEAPINDVRASAPENQTEGPSSPATLGKPRQPQGAWHTDPVQTLRSRLQSHLDKSGANGSAAELRGILSLAALDDPAMRVEVEAALVRHISQNDPSRAWIMAANRRFGWREDGVGFMRRFPWAAGAQQKILQAAFAEELAKPPLAKKPGLSPTEKGLLGGLGLFLLIVLNEYLSVNYPHSWANFNRLLVLMAIIALLSALILFVIELTLISMMGDEINQRSKLYHWSSRLRRWWARPAWRFSKRQILYAGLILLSVMVFTPLVSNPVALSKPWRSSVSMEAEGLYRRMFLSPRKLNDRSPDFRMAEVPNFVVPAGGATDQSDPYDIDAWRAFRSKTASSREHNPDAILSCDGPSSCQLGIQYDLGAVRVMVNEAGQRYTSIMTGPVINLRTDDTATVDVSWPNAPLAQRNPSRYTKNQNDPSDDRLFLFKIGMYEPFVTYRGGSVALQSSFENLPIGLLAHPISLRFDWPESLEEASSCSHRSEKMALADCGLDAGDTYDRQTFVCPPGDDGDACRNNLASGSNTSESTLDMMEQVNGSFVSAPTNDMNLLLQTLLYRMTIGGSHPPLPDGPETRTLYRQVQRDYAIILDQPEAAADRENREALRAALSRQPHLYRAMRAKPDTRQAIWYRFQAQLETVGFSR